MKFMQPGLVTNVLLVSVFIMVSECSAVFAVEGAGEILRQLEKTDKTYQFKDGTRH